MPKKVKQKTLLFSPFANWTLHYETDLELAQKALDRGNELTIIYCTGELASCELNPKHVSVMCKRCQARRDNGFHWLNNKKIKYISLTEAAQVDDNIIERMVKACHSIEDVQKFEIDGNDLGMAAISSTVSFFREPELSWDLHGKILIKHLHTAIKVYYIFSAFLMKNHFDEIIFFNGRYSSFRPLLRLSQKMNIKAIVHERGFQRGTILITENAYPHAIEYSEDQILKYANDSYSDDKKREIADQWFKERRGGDGHNWKSFTQSQQYGSLPDNFTSEKFNIVIFNSSEDEMVAIEEWRNPYYKNQNEGIQKIAESLKLYGNIHIFVRIHPNLGGIENMQTHFLRSLDSKYSNITMISPESSVSTYALIQTSDMVVTFGSTVGIEAAYMEKPSIAMGKNPYLVLNACIMPINHQAMIEIVVDYMNYKKLPSCDTTKAYLYGYYMKMVGEEFQYVKQIDISKALMIKDGRVRDLNQSIGVYVTWIERGILKIWKILIGKV